MNTVPSCAWSARPISSTTGGSSACVTRCSSLDAASLTAHLDHEAIAQLYVRLTTQKFAEAIRARERQAHPHLPMTNGLEEFRRGREPIWSRRRAFEFALGLVGREDEVKDPDLRLHETLYRGAR